MKHLKTLSIKGTQLIYGGTTHSGKYYGNGVYCTENKYIVDWAKAITCISGMNIGVFLGGSVPKKC